MNIQKLGLIPKGYRVGAIGEVANITAGGDKPIEFSEDEDETFKVPIFSNGIPNEAD